MNIYINLKQFTNKSYLLQAIKIFNATNNNVTFYINASKEDVLTISENEKIHLLNENINFGIINYNKYDVVIEKDCLLRVKEIVFMNNLDNYLNISFILKNNNFRSYIFEYNKGMSLENRITHIQKAISFVKNEKKKENISCSIIEKSESYIETINALKNISILPISDFLLSNSDLIIIDDFLMSIIKESFKCLDTYYNKEEENNKKSSGLSAYFFKNYLPSKKEKDILKYISKYSFVTKNNTTFININFELNVNEFRAILMNICN